ncbi:hypothetical protein [Prauserella endophytica]|uniref:Uncharacterized protein n=1 Tax=Prauserella endophytica TaxID=1592324 RepID=A0ABY2RZE0_9PSEU|nr:hypothetical protein [Prauserella endophytica]TKG66193.1 hypothetical protein FCN18_25470 [Prauserella endophytica]
MTVEAVLVALALIALYVIACIIWPFAPCGRCNGAGRFRSPSGKAWRACRRCRGSGRKERLGRKLLTLIK